MKSRAAIKVALMQKAEAVIDELLDWHVETDQPNLTQVEGKVLELRQRLSEQMAETVIEQQAAVRPVPGPRGSTRASPTSFPAQSMDQPLDPAPSFRSIGPW